MMNGCRDNGRGVCSGVGGAGGPKKKQRVGASSCPSSVVAVIESDGTVNEISNKMVGLRRASSHPLLSLSATSGIVCGGLMFNDSNTADVILRLYVEQLQSLDLDSDDSSSISSVGKNDVQIYLHSEVLGHCKYFSTLLSDRWQKNVNGADSQTSRKIYRLNLAVPATADSFEHHVVVLQLLYSKDFSTVLDSASKTLSILPVALELLFEDCVSACVQFLESVPWTEEEEKKVLSLVPFLKNNECEELLARVSPGRNDSSEEMLHELIVSANHNYHRAYVKVLIAKMLRDFLSKESAKRVLDRAFEASFKIVKESLEKYCSPDFRVDHNETEALQRLNLHNAMKNGRHLLWLIERMIELRVADAAMKEWSEQTSFCVDLQKAFRDDVWRSIAPGLPSIVLRCSCRFAHALTNGTVLASRQIRTKIVKSWLPVLIVCKNNLGPSITDNKAIHVELEERFLEIISTLPMAVAQKLLLECLNFSTRTLEDCPHLIEAFNTWFRRANRSLPLANNPRPLH